MPVILDEDDEITLEEDKAFTCSSCDAEFQIIVLNSSDEIVYCPFCGNETLTVDDEFDEELGLTDIDE